MKELFMRAPCFGGRGFDSSEYLTLPEREWWTRASVATSTKNVQESLRLVQESRNGRQIRGFILDEELALLDKTIREIMEEYQLGIWSKSTDRLALDMAEREKLKSTMLMEKELLLICAASPPVKTGVQKQNMTTQLDLQDKSVARTTRSLDHSPIISTDTCMDRIEENVTCKTPSIEDETESISMTTQLDLQDKSVAWTPRSLDHTPIISVTTQLELQDKSVARTPRSLDHSPIISTETDMETAPCKTQSNVDEIASISMTTQLDLQIKSVARTPRSLDHTPIISTETGMETEETVARKTQSVEVETECLSNDTPIKIQKEKIGFRKRTRSFFAKFFRSIGSCVCCGRRAATDEY